MTWALVLLGIAILASGFGLGMLWYSRQHPVPAVESFDKVLLQEQIANLVLALEERTRQAQETDDVLAATLLENVDLEMKLKVARRRLRDLRREMRWLKNDELEAL